MAIPAGIEAWDSNQLVAATRLVVLAWGRGMAAHEALPVLREDDQLSDSAAESMASSVINDLNAWQQSAPEGPAPIFMLAIVSLLGEQAAEKLEETLLPELLLKMDELALRQGTKTCFQEQMLEVFSDAAGL